MEIKTKHDISDQIRIKPLNCKGTIVGFYYGETGIQYQTTYFLNGERKTTYLYETEIDDGGHGEALGFTTS